eukprot:SAG22_NODE_165_length_16780_cov_57.761525_3_plen_236_part_00
MRLAVGLLNAGRHLATCCLLAAALLLLSCCCSLAALLLLRHRTPSLCSQDPLGQQGIRVAGGPLLAGGGGGGKGGKAARTNPCVSGSKTQQWELGTGEYDEFVLSAAHKVCMDDTVGLMKPPPNPIEDPQRVFQQTNSTCIVPAHHKGLVLNSDDCRKDLIWYQSDGRIFANTTGTCCGAVGANNLRFKMDGGMLRMEPCGAQIGMCVERVRGKTATPGESSGTVFLLCFHWNSV